MKRIVFTALLIAPLLTNVFAQSKKPQAKPAAKPASSGVSSASFKSSVTRGKVVYTTYCLPCHMADAGGVPNLNPPLIKTKYVLGDKPKLINVLLKGLNEEIEINDEVYSNPMPPHNFLTDQQIADVLTYVRNNFGNKASAVTPAEVKALRK